MSERNMGSIQPRSRDLSEFFQQVPAQIEGHGSELIAAQLSTKA
jgi:hypothetical protein